jgi:two-component system response regulator GlrR
MTDIQDINSPTRPSGRRRSDRIVGASRATQEAVDQASAAARSSGTVIVGGPAGSGRSHLARAIHAWSNRANRPLTAFTAAATPEDEQQRELFGCAEGGEPLLDGGRDGVLSRAGEGSLLIESVDLLSPAARGAVIQAIKDDRFTRVGESESLHLRARVLLTTQDDGVDGLRDAGAHHIRLAPLSDRAEDVLPLAAHFLAEHAQREGAQPIGFTGDARRWLVEERWLGNVRELSERIRQAVRLAGDGAISAEALLLAMESDEVPSFKEAKRAFETRYVEGLLRRCGGNISRAARLAKKDRKDFYDVIRRTGVDPAQFRR